MDNISSHSQQFVQKLYLPGPEHRASIAEVVPLGCRGPVRLWNYCGILPSFLFSKGGGPVCHGRKVARRDVGLSYRD